MKDDFKFAVQLADRDGSPITKVVFIDAIVYLKRKVRYRFNLGATDSSGLIEVSFSRLEQIRQENQEGNIMDYNTPLTDCDSIIELVVPSAMELEQRREAARHWYGEDGSSAPGIVESQNEEIACAPTTVDVDAEAGGKVLLQCGAA